MTDFGDLRVRRAALGRIAKGGIVAAGLSGLLALGAILVPIEAEKSRGANLRASERDFQIDGSGQSPELRSVAAKIATMELMRPARIQAAVKDDGTAQRLAKLLKLQGVVLMGDEFVAYIQVDKEGLQTVRERQTVSEFVVEKIEPGRVTLSLQGVTVVLGR